MVEDLYYCKRCGRLVIHSEMYLGGRKPYCDCCGATVYRVPSEFLLEGDLPSIKSPEAKEQFINEYVKTAPEFDQEAFDNRDRIRAEQSERNRRMREFDEAVLGGRGKGARCPICGSANISRIGVVGRAVSVGLFGLASSKIGKTHKCNSCGSTW